MIQSISAYSTSASASKLQRKANDVAKNPVTQSQTIINSPKANMAIRQNALANISFGSAASLGAVVEDFQAYIPNIFDVEKSDSLESTGMGGQNKGLQIDAETNPEEAIRNYIITQEGSDKSSIKISKSMLNDNLPQVRLKTGKFAPVAEIVDKEIGIKIQVLPGANVENENGFSIINAGKAKTGSDSKNISFQGRGDSQVVVFNKEDRVYDASESYRKSGVHSNVERGDAIDLVQNDRPTFMVLAGGYGTRLFDYADCKPAAKLPTDPNYTLMCNALDQMAKSGYLDNSQEDAFEYLSGKGTLKGDNVKQNLQETNLGDGGCIAKALALDTTKTDAPLIILNADTITNADITRAYEAYKKNADAAILIPYYEAAESRAKDFGLMQAVPRDNGTLEIKSFVEKPKTLEAAAPAKVQGKDKYMANPGIYIIGPQALSKLKNMGVELMQSPKELGLAKNFITPLVEACQKGEFKDENGEPMKCYTSLLEKKGGGAAFWDDLGKDVTIPETFRLMAKETSTHGADSPENLFYGLPKFMLNDAVDNVDQDSGVTFMNKSAREKLAQFEEKYGATTLNGNCIVYDNAD
ncbi:MAG: sugar phosphate nucleotidyltransferase [Candidatus Gastranaerophilales bacterium]|nr:sugar phosphate nucleotidyltransferase [Candidatus Gastranaerophilales bacterium]